MWKPDICVYHGSCDDGFASAWVVHKKWPECRFVPGTYGKPLPKGDMPWIDTNVLFVDFSLKEPDTLKLLNTVKSIIIIDHHKTAEAELKSFVMSWCDCDADLELMLQATTSMALFDIEHSGAMMTWHFCFPGQHPPELIRIVQDRDLWRFALTDTKRISAALRVYPQDFSLWDHLSKNLSNLNEEGAAILRSHSANIEKFMNDKFYMPICGYIVPCCNVPYHYASDTAHELLNSDRDAPFAACFFKRGDGKWQFSLRSENDRTDVSEIAKKYGGGGHRNAAGFEVESLDYAMKSPMTKESNS
jgi:nanoRNase/pAp phosphatase (c-di-AMP/oligoRNAs hydrolase)